MATANHRILVFTSPVEGRENDYNEWYDNIHVGEVLQVEGFVGCQRLAANPASDAPAKYLAIYEVDADDPVAAWDTLQKSIPNMNMTDALDFSSVAAWIFTARGERIAV